MHYVASTTLKEPLAWSNSTLLKGDVPEAVTKLKAQPGKDFLMMGSGAGLRRLSWGDLGPACGDQGSLRPDRPLPLATEGPGR